MVKYFFREGNNNIYTCSRCNWEGDTPDIRDGEKSESVFLYEAFCPTCKKYLEMWQGEIIDMLIPKNKEGQKEFYKKWIKNRVVLLIGKKKTEEAELKLGQMRATLMKANEELKAHKFKFRVG